MTNRTAVTAPRIFDGERWHEDAALVLDEGRIEGIVAAGTIAHDLPATRLAAGFLAPGFIDLQVNGGGGVLFNNDLSVEGIEMICRAHARFGTTRLLPTLISDTPEVTKAAIAAGIAAAEKGVPGFGGLHIEGPHLSAARKGAHDAQLIRPMGDEDMNRLIAARTKLPALMTTVAPESVNPQQVQALSASGIAVSIGHTEATFAAASALAEAGAAMVTHLFNAMSQMTGREPGVVGAALAIGGLSAGLIADGHHVHPVSMRLALAAKQGPGRIFLVTDAMSPVGTDATELVLNGRRVRRENGKLLLDDGTLAGADLDMANAVRVIHRQAGASLEEALRMAALYPARALRLTGGEGTLQPGAPADFVWLDDAITARGTWIGGKPIEASRTQG